MANKEIGSVFDWFEPPAGATAQSIAAIEASFARTLPEEIRKLITAVAGGVPDSPSDFDFIDNTGTPFQGCVSSFLMADGTGVGTILWYVRLLRSEGHEQLLPFANAGGGNLICCTLDGTPQPPVVYWHHEAVGREAVSPLAPDTEAFIKMLQPPDTDDDDRHCSAPGSSEDE